MAKSEGQRRSKKQEERLAQVTGGRTVGGSGSGWSHKGDVVTDGQHIEAKWTGKNSFSVSSALWRKLEGEAIPAGKTPVLAIRLEPSDLNLIVLDENDYLTLLEESQRRGGHDGSA